MRQYHDFLTYILNNGIEKKDRTGTGTVSVFVPPTMRFDLTKGFPLVTTKKIHWKSVAHELIWFLRGDTNIKYLKDNGVSIWDEWADANGDLGPIYGKQWREWEYRLGDRRMAVDQLANVIQQIKQDPDSRRLIVSAWNPPDIPQMKLPPCHMMFQFYTRYKAGGGRFLDCHLYQRSADAFLGVPFNIASYALLTHIVARLVNMTPGAFYHTCGDAHIYSNHREQIWEQLQRPYRDPPRLVLSDRDFTIDTITFEDIHLLDYNPHPAIKAPVAV